MNDKRLTPGLNDYLPEKPILTSAETAKLMGFPSGDALGKARLTGRLPIDMFQLPGRRGWFAATHAVRAWLEASVPEASKDWR